MGLYYYSLKVIKRFSICYEGAERVYEGAA